MGLWDYMRSFMPGYASEQQPPPPRLLTTRPWRTFREDGIYLEIKLKEDIRKLQPEKKPKLLLIGSVGAGKSSFINSCLSVSAGRKVKLALTGSTDRSFTLKSKTYTDEDLLAKFRIMDCMGLEAKYQAGLDEEDISFLIKGHIKNGHTFHPYSPISDKSRFYRDKPTFENKTHCVVFVVDANVVWNGIQPALSKKIRELQDKITTAEVPRAMILTKADVLCEKVKYDTSNMFRSIKVREAVDKASEIFRIDKASIHPVVNYVTVFELTNEKNIPILLAMRDILQCAADKVQYDLCVDDED